MLPIALLEKFGFQPFISRFEVRNMIAEMCSPYEARTGTQPETENLLIQYQSHRGYNKSLKKQLHLKRGFWYVCCWLPKDQTFIFYLLLLQLVLCRVAAVKSLPVHHP